MKRLKNKSFKCDDDLWKELDEICKLLRTTKSSFIRIAIIEKIRRCTIAQK